MRGSVAKRLRKLAVGMATRGNEMDNKTSKIFVMRDIEGEVDNFGAPKRECVEKEFTRVAHAEGSIRGTYKALKKAYKRG